MTPDDSWQAAQFQDELIRLQSILDSLEAAKAAGVPEIHLVNLAAECGVAKEYQRQ